jgi:hypothetical protein
MILGCGDSDSRTVDAPLPSLFDAAAERVNDAPADAWADAAEAARRDVSADQIVCPAGATEADCRTCGATLPSGCDRVCPAVDCSGYPRPAECDDVCARKCCACQASVGMTPRWQAPVLPCTTVCGDMLERWEAYLADPAMVACRVNSDCTVVGGQPRLDPCNGHSAIGYCGRAVNAAAYAASPAANLETEFPASCPDHKAYDCGPPGYGCINGKCTIGGWLCCNCPPDAGPDVPMSRPDGASEAGGVEAKGGEAGTSETAAGDVGSSEAGRSEAGGSG